MSGSSCCVRVVEMDILVSGPLGANERSEHWARAKKGQMALVLLATLGGLRTNDHHRGQLGGTRERDFQNGAEQLQRHVRVGGCIYW